VQAWLSKNSIPSGRVNYVLTLPDDETWRADFLGAFFLLTQSENWEESGVLSPVQMADEWIDLFGIFQRGEESMIPVGTILPFGGDTAPAGFFLCDWSEFNRADYAALFAVIGTKFGVGNGTTTANLPPPGGRVLVGLNAADPDFNLIGKVGGVKTVTLATTQIPAHTHVQNSHNHTQDTHNHVQNSHNHVQNSHNHVQNSHNHGRSTQVPPAETYVSSVIGSGAFGYAAGNRAAANETVTSTEQAINQATTPTNQATTPTNITTVATNQAATAVNQNAGGGQSHDNMPPYCVTNFIIKY